MSPPTYYHFRIQTAPLAWRSASDQIASQWTEVFDADAALYGIWRNQIGRPRDELNILAYSPRELVGTEKFFPDVEPIVHAEAWSMSPTLRPRHSIPPQQQGNYAFRYFRTAASNWDEFLQLCDEAWPAFEAAYPDCEIIGHWRYGEDSDGLIDSVLLTRRPNLAAWERTKIPQGEAEVELRRKLSRRYDLCNATYVHTTTLLTASDTADTTRWT